MHSVHMLGVEGIQDLEECDRGCEHHLFDVAGYEGKFFWLHIADVFEESTCRDVDVPQIDVIVGLIGLVEECCESQMESGGFQEEDFKGW